MTKSIFPESLRLIAAFIDSEPQRNSDAQNIREAANYIEELEEENLRMRRILDGVYI